MCVVPLRDSRISGSYNADHPLTPSCLFLAHAAEDAAEDDYATADDAGSVVRS